MRRETIEERLRQQRLQTIWLADEKRRKLKRRAKRLGRVLALNARRRFASAHNLILDRDLSREPVVLPACLSFRENYRETVEAIEKMRETCLRGRKPIMVHFENIRKVDLAAALVLVAELFRLQNLRGTAAVHGTYPALRSTYDLLSEMGFFDLLKIRDRFNLPKKGVDPSRPIFLRFLTDNRLQASGVDSFVGLIERHLIPLSLAARGKLVGAIKEAMGNTLDHAHPSGSRVVGETMPHRWWMSSWINVEQHEVMIMLFDQGVGIPVTLGPQRYGLVRAALTKLGLSEKASDGEMIMAATELFRTGTGQTGRGCGFRDMKRFVDVCDDGELRVLSNRGRYSYMGGTETYGDESMSIGGTIIEWRFRNEGSVDLDDE